MLQPAGPAPQQPSQPATSPDGKNYETLGGWLLFFVVSYGLSAAMNLWRLIRGLGELGMLSGRMGSLIPSMTCLALIYLVGIVADVLTVVIIVKRRPDFLRLFQIISIARAGVCIFLEVINSLALMSYISSYRSGWIVSALVAAVGAAIGLVLMTMYFCKSERVRVYMGSTEYLDTALFKIGA